jgi:N-acetylglucosaminyl-diphospho-decaprenol L-rhamnosyltransferase
MSSAEIAISVIIVTNNSAAVIEECLGSLRAALVRHRYELIVVDNNSTDHSATVAGRVASDATILTNRDNRGFARACNQGAASANGRYLFFVNPDVTVDLDAVDPLLDVFGEQQRIGLASARLRHLDGRFHATCRRFPTIRNMLLSRGSFLSRIFRYGPRRLEAYTLPDYATTTIVEAVAATMVMIKRDLFLSCGGFDERFFLYMEDTDLSLRLNRLGYVNVFVPTAGGVHRWGTGSRAGKLFRQWHQHRSVWKYFRKHRTGTAGMALLAPSLIVNFILVSILPVRRRSA